MRVSLSLSLSNFQLQGVADFYGFLKTLDTYKATLGRDSTLILTTDSDLFKLLKRVAPE